MEFEIIDEYNDFKEKNLNNNKKLFSLLKKSKPNIEFNLKTAEILFQAMMTDEDLFKAEHRDVVKYFLTKYGLFEKKKVCFVSSTRLDKPLV